MSAFSSKLSMTSMTLLHEASRASVSGNLGRTSSVFEAALPKRRSASPRSRAFCLSRAVARDGSSDRWNPKSSVEMACDERVTATREAWICCCRELKSASASMISGGRNAKVTSKDFHDLQFFKSSAAQTSVNLLLRLASPHFLHLLAAAFCLPRVLLPLVSPPRARSFHFRKHHFLQT